MVALQQDLSRAEVEREQLSRQCKLLQDVKDKQASLSEENRLQIQGLEASVLALEKERDRTEKKCQQLEGLLQRAEVELRGLSAEKDRTVTSLERASAEKARLQSAVAALEERLTEADLEGEKGLAANKVSTSFVDVCKREMEQQCSHTYVGFYTYIRTVSLRMWLILF